MKQRKSLKRNIASALLMFVILAANNYFFVSSANAVVSLTDASDLLTDSDAGVTADHLFTFTNTVAVPAGGYLEAVFPADFGNVVGGNITCSGGGAASAPNTETARCTYAGGSATGVHTITVTGVTNPAEGSEGSKLFTIYHKTSANVVTEQVQVRVFIIQDILMTAHVDATLQFVVSGLDADTIVNTVTCTATTTATTTPFGTLNPGSQHTVCQQLNVTTNATKGFTVTVEQDNELKNSQNDTINSFDNSGDGTGSTTAHAWAIPAGLLDQKHTYGHMGLTSDDEDLVSVYPNQDYDATNHGGTPYYAGFNAAAAIPVFHHNGPADGSTGATQNKGMVKVAYTAQINALQEAGDYQNTLTYIVTPTY